MLGGRPPRKRVRETTLHIAEMQGDLNRVIARLGDVPTVSTYGDEQRSFRFKTILLGLLQYWANGAHWRASRFCFLIMTVKLSAVVSSFSSISCGSFETLVNFSCSTTGSQKSKMGF